VQRSRCVLCVGDGAPAAVGDYYPCGGLYAHSNRGTNEYWKDVCSISSRYFVASRMVSVTTSAVRMTNPRRYCKCCNVSLLLLERAYPQATIIVTIGHAVRQK
ncbi:unnamed protein product, partial [Ectocarpus sp. 8 AP-2014]